MRGERGQPTRGHRAEGPRPLAFKWARTCRRSRSVRLYEDASLLSRLARCSKLRQQQATGTKSREPVMRRTMHRALQTKQVLHADLGS